MSNLSQETMTQIKLAAKWIKQSKYLVVFTGAGISTPSGLPDYRGPEGVWTLKAKGLKPKPLSKPWSEHQPNVAHHALVELQNMGKMKYLISQNVDGLHVKSGIKMDKIAELHGNSTLIKCIDCDKRYTKKEVKWDDRKYGRGYRTQTPIIGQPDCPVCRGRIISSVINFDDPMPEKELRLSEKHSKKSDVYFVIGSSLTVQPAASLPVDAVKKGAKLIILNQGKTALDDLADLRMYDDCAAILPKILNIIKN